jgi:purine-binding chemotaxis protein CheW
MITKSEGWTSLGNSFFYPSTDNAPQIARHRSSPPWSAMSEVCDSADSAELKRFADAGVHARWLLCGCGSHLFALPLDAVIEIMRPLPLKVVADMPAYVRGVCIVRGAPVPVVDVGLLVTGTTEPIERLVSIRAGMRKIALAVSAVVGVHATRGEDFNDLPPLLRGAGREAIVSIARLDAELLFCLEAARLVPEDVLARLDLEDASP